MKKRILKLNCFMITIIMILSLAVSSNVGAISGKIDDTDTLTHDHEVNIEYDTEYYRDYYSNHFDINFVIIEIDGVIYYVREDIEITEDFLDSIRISEDIEFNISALDNFEYDDVYGYGDIYIDDGSEDSIEENPCMGAHSTWGCGLQRCGNCGFWTNVAHVPGGFGKIHVGSDTICYALLNICRRCQEVITMTSHSHNYNSSTYWISVGSQNVCRQQYQYCSDYDCSRSRLVSTLSNHSYSFGICACLNCGYRSEGAGHRYNYQTYILAMFNACYESRAECINSGCSYNYIHFVEYNHKYVYVNSTTDRCSICQHIRRY